MLVATAEGAPSLENPNTKPSARSNRMISASRPSADDSVADSSRPPKPAPSTRIRARRFMSCAGG